MTIFTDEEYKEFDVWKHYQHDARAKGHKFVPNDVDGRMGDNKLYEEEENYIDE